jgi:hypothetical protein
MRDAKTHDARLRAWVRGLALCEDLLAVTNFHASDCENALSIQTVDTRQAGAPRGNPGLARKTDQAKVSAWRAIASSSLVG